MKPDRSLFNSTISLLLMAALLLPAFAVPVFSQHRPIVITFGQPNIWSLEQAHYLLARMHRQNLDLQTARLGDLDPNATNASRIDILKTLLSAGVSFDQAVGLNNQLLRRDRTFNSQRRQELLNNRSNLQTESTQLARDISALRIAKANATTAAERDQIQSNIEARTEEKAAVDNQLTQTNDEAKGLTSASGDFQKAEVSNEFSSQDLAGDLDTLISRVQLVNPSIAATLRLDAHIGLQYEIISKQLALLRDEVGPGERLVFLELPQSINATQDRAENKMAQTWWRIAGYTKVDKEWLLQKELEALAEKINAIRLEVGRAIQNTDDQEMKLQRERLAQAFTSLSKKYEKLKLEKIRDQIRESQNEAERLLQGGSARTKEVIDETFDVLRREGNFRLTDLKWQPQNQTEKTKCAGIQDAKELSKCKSRTFVDLEEIPPDIKGSDKKDSGQKDSEEKTKAELRRRFVRTVDIIPRQNAINVQDTKQTVSKTGIFAAVSFLFGFAGKFTYERQREHAEQFLNQELFTSGFGKGEKVFGWSFFPFAGTRQLSSGVRTTYAVAIIPDDAESIVLKARGCYFPRKENQPVNYDQTGEGFWTDKDDISKRFCTPSEQVFVVPVPGGTGDGADYYVTGMRYAPNRGPGERMIAMIQGQNLPSQVGILINGVPLREAVGLGQLNIESLLDERKTRDNCASDICGRFERIDSHQIVISFSMPNDFTGSPRIGVIGPGKSIELNRLFLSINGHEDVQLDSAEMMFGDPPDSTLRRIADFRVAPPRTGSTKTIGVLTGSRFQVTDQFQVNGLAATKGSPCRSDLCILEFPPQTTDFLTVTISPALPKERAVSKTFVNPTNLSVISAAAVSYTPTDGPRVGVMTVKIDGSGFKPELKIAVEGGNPNPDTTIPSAGQMFLKIVDPEPVVQITITDGSSNRTVRAIVVRPEPPPREKK